MKNLFLLLLLVGVVGVGYQYREKIFARSGGSVPEEPSEDHDAPGPKKPNATPHPATDSTAAAIRAYPALAQKESAFNKAFLMLHSQAQQNEPDLLARPDWPMTLAKRAAASLAPTTTAAPRTPPATPWQHQGSALDKRPSGSKGSSPDQHPSGLPPR